MSDITLTTAQRISLLALQDTTSLYNRTQQRLDTDKKVSTASDDAVAYYRSQALYDRANALTGIKSSIDQNVQALNTTQVATSAVQSLLQQLKAVIQAAQAEGPTQQASSTAQFKDLTNQLAQLVQDASYQGLNLLTSSNALLTTQFSERSAATFAVSGYDLISTIGGSRALFTQNSPVFNSSAQLVFSNLVAADAGGGAPGAAVIGFSQLNLSASATAAIPGAEAQQIFTGAENRIDAAINQIEAITTALGTNVGILSARSTFTLTYANDLTSGADSLTVADLNTEAANSSALQLRQQLGIQSLSVTQTLNQSILQLLK